MPDYDFWIVLKGEGELELNSHCYAIHPGTCFILPPGSKVKGFQSPEKSLLVFFMHFDLFDQKGSKITPEDWCVPSPGTVVYDLELLQGLCRHVIRQHDAISESGPLGFNLAVWQLLQIIDSAAQKQNYRKHDQRIQQAIEQIEQDFDRDWAVEDMAAVAGLSRTHFTRRFKAETGFAPNAYLVHKRISQASVLIRESGMTINQIAYGLGYSDVAFFNRQFKSVTGVTPGSLRNQF